jgi:hypothetical protein
MGVLQLIRNTNFWRKNMTVVELSKKLSEMYENADDGDKVAMIHLFGIRYGKIIEQN